MLVTEIRPNHNQDNKKNSNTLKPIQHTKIEHILRLLVPYITLANIKVAGHVCNPLQALMDHHQNFHAGIQQYRHSFLVTVWYKCDTTLVTLTSESDSGFVIIVI